MFGKMNIPSRHAMRILCFLGRNYMEKYHTREIVRQLNLSLGTASKNLRILEEEELIIKENLGRLTIYQANMENPLLKELKELKEFSSKIILFGSCATGEDRQESDIDLVVLTGDIRHANKLVEKHQMDISRKISPIIMEEVEFRHLKKEDKPFYSRVMKGRTLYEISV